MYPVVPMSTTKVVVEIISTFVGYNILLILMVRPLQRESCSFLSSDFLSCGVMQHNGRFWASNNSHDNDKVE